MRSEQLTIMELLKCEVALYSSIHFLYHLFYTGSQRAWDKAENMLKGVPNYCRVQLHLNTFNIATNNLEMLVNIQHMPVDYGGNWCAPGRPCILDTQGEEVGIKPSTQKAQDKDLFIYLFFHISLVTALA